MVSRSDSVLSVASVVIVTLTGCSDPGTPAECSADAFFDGASTAASEEGTALGWRELIDSLVAQAPADSLVEAAVIYVSWPTDGDRQVLSEVGATIVYEFNSFAGLVISVPVGGLAVIARSPRVQHLAVADQNLMPMTAGC